MQVIDKFRFKLRQEFILKKRKLLNKAPSIICNNCVGGIIYHEYNLPFLSPTINLYFFYPDYIRFLERLEYVIDLRLTFQRHSRHIKGILDYPIGILDHDIEIHFIHYEDDRHALTKWEERCSRINWDNLFIMGSDRDGCTFDDIRTFDNLPYKNKIMFTSKPYPEFNSALYINKYKERHSVGDMIGTKEWFNYYDCMSWLNGNGIKRHSAAVCNILRILNK